MKIKKAKDANGLTVAKVTVQGKRGFSIQTNGNLPEIHREFVWEGKSFSNNEREIRDWVREHGTDNQKETVKLF